MYSRGGHDRTNTKVMGISISRCGWAKGLTVLAASPMSGPGWAAARESFYDEVQLVEQTSRGADIVLIIGGDVDDGDHGLLGRCVAARRSVAGVDLFDFSRSSGVVVASTLFQQRESCTWWHMRCKTGHRLDHILTRYRDKALVTRVSTLRFGQGGREPGEVGDARGGT